MYQYAKPLFVEQGIIKKDKKALVYVNKSSNNGFQKSKDFLNAFYQMEVFTEFNKINQETKLFFINNSISKINQDNQKLNIFNQIHIKLRQIEMLFISNSLKETNFHSFSKASKSIDLIKGGMIIFFNDLQSLKALWPILFWANLPLFVLNFLLVKG